MLTLLIKCPFIHHAIMAFAATNIRVLKCLWMNFFETFRAWNSSLFRKLGIKIWIFIQSLRKTKTEAKAKVGLKRASIIWATSLLRLQLPRWARALSNILLMDLPCKLFIKHQTFWELKTNYLTDSLTYSCSVFSTEVVCALLTRPSLVRHLAAGRFWPPSPPPPKSKLR